MACQALLTTTTIRLMPATSPSQMLKQFFLAIQGSTYNSFLKQCSTLDHTIRTNPDSLQKDTLDAIYSAVSVIDIASTGLLQIQSDFPKLEQEIQTDILQVLSEDMSHLRIANDSVSKRSTAPSTPSYVKPAYSWLLSNLHNPYPSKEMKKTFSRDTKCSIKDIDAWFIDVRKRIGWNSLRKSRFDNKQEKIIAAAARVFNPKTTSYSDDLNVSLISEMDTNDDHRSAFLTIKRNARALYADKFPDLLSQFSDQVTYQVSPSAPPKFDGQRENLDLASPFTSFGETQYNPYPTPEPSPRSLADDAQISVSQHPHQILESNIRKRREPSQDDSSEHSETSCHPPKRFRYEDNHINSLSETTISSPPQQAPEIATTTLTTAIIPTAQKRKRRLSDAHCHPPSKRPHNALCVPRLQAVSDPLPVMKSRTLHLSGSSEERENTLGEEFLIDIIPCPLNLEDPNPPETSLNLDFHLYDLSPYNFGIHLPEFPDAHDREIMESGVPHPPIDVASTVEPFTHTHSLQESGLEYIDTSNMQFYATSMPSYQPNFQYSENNTTDDFGVFLSSDLLLSTPGYSDFSSLLLNGVHSGTDNLSDFPPLLTAKPAVLRNSNHSVPKISEEQAAKRARAQELRQELARYEAEGL